MESSSLSDNVQTSPEPPRILHNHHTARGNIGSSRRRGPLGDRGRSGTYRGRGRGVNAHQNANHRATRGGNLQHLTTDAAEAQDIPLNQPSPTNANTTSAEDTDDRDKDVEAEVCFICASPVVHNSVAPCNHRTCHICALRMRALYKNKACMHCRTNSDYVVFTDDPNKRYEAFSKGDFVRVDENLGIQYESSEIFEDTVLLLRYNCPEESCDIACYGWPDLHRHVRNVHNKVMCDLCTRNKKVFTHEHTLFTHNELRKHEKFGDDNPGAVDQSGFKGHPECGFCKQRFYGDDELYVHCRDRHERCHICDRRSGGREQQYYLDYDALEVHFKKDHFLCPDHECMEKKFVVFESEMDLKAHQLEAHPNGLSKDARRDARRVDMSGFDYRAPHQEPRGGRREGRDGREGRGRGRGRDPNTDALPVSSAQPMRRDELAYQRQLAIHSAQSVSNRNFGGQLTSSDTYAARAPTAVQEIPTVTATRTVNAANEDLVPSIDLLSLESGTTSTVTLTPQERARQLRHSAVIERASHLLQNNSAKLTTFRSKVSAFRTSSVSAEVLIDSFFALFDTSSTELGKLVKEVADIFEVPGKRDELLKAWNDWRAINEDYPSLPGPDGLPAGGNSGTGSGGKRILKLKSSTAQSSRSAVSRQGSWGTAAGSRGTSSTPFPPMPVTISANRAGAGRVSATPWVSTAPPPATSMRPSPAPSRPASVQALGPIPRADAFPSLPNANKPGMNVSRPGYVGNPVLKARSGTSTPVNPWANVGGAGVSGLTAALDIVAAEGEDAGKKKGKKKQTLIHWG